MDIVVFILLALALVLVIGAEKSAWERLKLATLETVRGIVFIFTLGRVRMRPRMMAARSKNKSRIQRFKYWLEDRKVGDLDQEIEDPVGKDPYSKWIIGKQSGGVTGLDRLKHQREDDFTHLGTGTGAEEGGAATTAEPVSEPAKITHPDVIEDVYSQEDELLPPEL